MTIDSSIVWALIAAMATIIGTLLLMLHKDIKKSIDNIEMLLHPITRRVDVHDNQIADLKETTKEHHERISKLENKVHSHVKTHHNE